jgi:type I restriction enzyme S subunit
MNKLDRLIAELCPDGVEYVPLGNVCMSTSNIKWKNESDRKYQYIDLTSVDRIEHKIIKTQTISAENAPSRAQQLVQVNDVIFATTRPILQRFCIVPVEYDDQICSTGFCVLRANMDQIIPSYIYHVIGASDFQEYVKGMQKGASYPTMTNGEVKAFSIPLPPLEVQREIVRILDSFAELTAKLTTELTAELTARKKQYEYYRDALLNFGKRGGHCQDEALCSVFHFDGEVQWKTLGDIGGVSMCKRIHKHETSLVGDVPFYKIGTFGKEADAYIPQRVYEEYRRNYPFPKKGDILISAAGTIGRSIIYDGEPAYYQDSNIVWIDNDEDRVLNKYLYYYYALQPWKTSGGGTISRLYNDNIRRTSIPIPPLAGQERIVAILDKFDALTTDITAGLTAEIEARRKQYEYYRDSLLTFKEKAA